MRMKLHTGRAYHTKRKALTERDLQNKDSGSIVTISH